MPGWDNFLIPTEFISTGIGSDGAESKHSTLPSSVALIPHALEDHTDVDNPLSPSPDDCLCWNGSLWVPISPANIIGNASLNDLNDVVVSPVATDCLCFDGINWTTITPSGIAGSVNLNDLADVNVGGASATDCLCYDGISWVPTTAAAIVSSASLVLSDLTDVSAIVPSTDDCLCWNGVDWAPTTPASIVSNGASAISLNDIGDVNAPTPSIGQCLCYDGADWIATNASSSGIAETIQTLRGTVGFAGTVDEGVGWTVAKPGTGTYQVTFSSPFSSPPTVVATGAESQAAPSFRFVIVIVSNVTINGFSVQTADWRGSPTEFFDSDQSWYFMAMGEPT